MTTQASSTAPRSHTPGSDRSKRRRKIAKFALAGVAVLGVGGALTSAAWTDDVFFAADATSASFDLQGSLDGITWFDVANVDDTSVTPIQIPATAFANLAPNDVRVVTLQLRNAGSVPIALTAPAVTETGALFNDAGANVGVTVGAYGTGSTLAVAGTTTFTVTLTAPNWTNTDYVNLTGDILVAVTGTSA